VLCLVLLFLSASFVAQLGIDLIVGSFIFGIVVPRNTHVFKACTTILEPFVTTLLLPLYFAVSGLHTDITQLNVYPDVPILLIVCAVSTLGKFIGAGCTSYLCGIGRSGCADEHAWSRGANSAQHWALIQRAE
jgi:Kef-type K+ transport system membrane component KefB